MFHWILVNVIGGETGKRESAIFLLSIWLAFSAYIVFGDFDEVKLQTLERMWGVFTPFMFLSWAGAMGLKAIEQRWSK